MRLIEGGRARCSRTVNVFTAKAGVIKYHRGHVTVVDREDLEAAPCEGYRAAADLLKAVTDGARA